MPSVPRTDELVERIIAEHRERLLALKMQTTLDRGLESHVRLNHTDWHPGLPAAERAQINGQVHALIKRALTGQGDERIAYLVGATEKSRKTWDDIRTGAEKAMTALASQLPVYSWVALTRGAGALGLATIVAEAGAPLDRFPNPAKLWARLAFAPYCGHAGSTWLRPSWRPRALINEEWKSLGFNPKRYALISQVGLYLRIHQSRKASKDSNSGNGIPTGPYGEVYAARRARTALTHPEWTKLHAHKDALRVTTKAYLRDLWCAWNEREVRTAVPHDHFSCDTQERDTLSELSDA
jgi:hypothetical protein